MQSFTYVFGLERRAAGERHVIEKPARYDFFRASQPYSLRIEVHGGEIYGEESGWLDYKVFEQMPGTKGGLWTYRRLIDSTQFPDASADLSMFNWPGNDYREASIIDRPAREVAAALQDAKRASLGFLHWVQTEAPAEADRLGAPELKLRPDIMGSADGLAKFPYIRESGASRPCAPSSSRTFPPIFSRGRSLPTSRTPSASVGIRSTFIVRARKTSASAAGRARFRFRSAP